MHQRRQRRGFMIVDLTIGLTLATALLMLMTVTVVKQRRSEQRMEKTRAAVRNAEAAMLALHAGQSVSEHARVDTLPDAAPRGYRWIRLTIPAANDLPASALVGLVPVAAPGGARP